MMTELFNIILEGFQRAFNATAYFIKHNLKKLSKGVLVALPFIMYYLGARYGLSKDGIAMWIIIPSLVFGLSAMINWIAKNYENKVDLPVPTKRFTRVDEDGEVTIETKRLQELIVWLSEYEDWLERKGIK